MSVRGAGAQPGGSLLMAFGAFYLLAMLAVFFRVFAPAEAAGWVLLIAGTALVFLIARRTTNPAVTAIIISGMTLRHIAALINTYWKALPGAGEDAVTMHARAVEIAAGTSQASFEAGSKFFVAVMATFYRAFGASYLLSAELVVLGFGLSCIVLHRLYRAAGGSGNAELLLLAAYALLPSSIFFTSAAMREAYQMLFLVGACLAGIRFRQQPGFRSMGVLLLWLVALASLHQGLVAFSLALLVWTCTWALWLYAGGRKTLRRVIGAVVVFGVIAGSMTAMSGLGLIGQRLSDDQALEFVGQRRGFSETSRAYYGGALDASSPIALARSVTLMVFLYLFAPLPWQVGSVADVYALVESVLRMVLLWLAIRNTRRASGDQRAILLYLVCTWLGLETLWALGTNNWGTAIRHHIVAYGLLLVAALVNVPRPLRPRRKWQAATRRAVPADALGRSRVR